MSTKRPSVAATDVSETTRTAFDAYYKGASEFVEFDIPSEHPPEEGYFTFHGATCYGRSSGGRVRVDVTQPLSDHSAHTDVVAGCVRLPFDLGEVITNLQQERYCRNSLQSRHGLSETDSSRRLYYFIRPLLP